MKTLDDLYKKCFIVNKDNIKIQHSENIFIIKNVFKNPDLVLEFQNLLSKWEACSNAKPGVMTLQLPYWTANFVIDQILDINYESVSCENEFVYFYWNNVSLECSIDYLNSNNCLLPHVDCNALSTQIVFLVNLNKRPITTAFWKYKNKYNSDSDEETDNFYDYCSQVTEENIHEKTNNRILDKLFDVQYDFNDAILYDSSLYHQPIIDKFYSRDNPRICLRMMFQISN
jgi:hypothetical protein